MSHQISSILYFLKMLNVSYDWPVICHDIATSFRQTNLDLIRKLVGKINCEFIDFLFRDRQSESGLYFDIRLLVQDNNIGKRKVINFLVLSIHITKEQLIALEKHYENKDYDLVNQVYEQLISETRNGIIHIHTDSNELFNTREYPCNFKLTQEVEVEGAAAAATFRPSTDITYLANKEAKTNDQCILIQPTINDLIQCIQDVLFVDEYLVSELKTNKFVPLSHKKPVIRQTYQIIKSRKRLDMGTAKEKEKYLKYKSKYLALKKLIGAMP